MNIVPLCQRHLSIKLIVNDLADLLSNKQSEFVFYFYYISVELVRDLLLLGKTTEPTSTRRVPIFGGSGDTPDP